MSSQIKGLSQFIADLRASNSQEAERARVQSELASVRKKIAAAKSGKDLGSKTKKGYEHRKIISKLLYIYILGYDVDLGNDEINTLLRMPNFAEKQVGYLALTILLHAHNELKFHIEPIVLEDLRSTKEVLTSLALNYVSTWESSQQASDDLVDLIYQLMVSPTSSSAVVKKAALTFMNFFRKDPQRFTSEPEWPGRVERITAILTGPNLGVATSLVSLLIEIANSSPESFSQQALSVVVRKLEDVFDGDGADASDYSYHQIFAPWLVAKLCRLLRTMVACSQQSGVDFSSARKVASSILSFCVVGYEDDPLQVTPDTNNSTNPQRINACNIIFYDAALLGGALDIYESEPSLGTATLLSMKGLLSSKDTNLRYFALRILRTLNDKLSSAIDAGSSKHITELVLRLVKDRDVTVRRKALDALFNLVDQNNVETIAAELLDLLVASDLMIRPLMVAKLAMLIERFATSHEWYFDTCITLLEIGGSYAGNEVWQRLVQVVVNNEALQIYAVSRLYEYFNDSDNARSHPTSASSSSNSEAIVKLGAFILGEFCYKYEGDPMNLFMILQDQIHSVSWSTKTILLSAYLKLACRFPNLRYVVLDAISMYRQSANLETQQRANEFVSLLKPENSDILASTVVKMPPFGEDVTTLLFQQMGHASTKSPGRDQTPEARPKIPNTRNVTGLNATLVPVDEVTMRQTYLSSNWEFGFRRMLTHSEAVLYQDAILQIGCRYDFRQSHGSIVLYLKNISTFEISSLNIQVHNPMSEEIMWLHAPDAISAVSLNAGQMIEQKILCEARQPFALTPTCRVTYLAGGFFESSFKLPITLERFMTPSAITMEQFTQRWEQLGEEFEFTKHFRNYSTSRAAKSVDDDREVVKGLQYGLVSAESTQAIFGAGILHTSQGGMFGSLIVLQTDAERNKFRISVRATRKKLVAVVLANNFAHVYQL